MVVACLYHLMTKRYRGIIGNRWKLPVIIVAVSCLAACATPPPVENSPTVPYVDYTRTKEMKKKYAGGRNFYNKGDFEHAILTLEPVWRWNPNHEEVSSYLVRSLLLSGLEFYAEQQYLSAIDRWKKALTIDPDNPKAKRYLARARLEVQKIGQADGE